MKNNDSFQKLFLLLSFCIILFFSTTFLYINKETSNIKNMYNINLVRVYTSEILNEIENNFSSIETVETNDKINLMLRDINSYAFVTDRTGKVLYSNNDIFVGDTVNLKEVLYQDYSYLGSNEGHYKFSFPIYHNENVEGFLIFEIPPGVISFSTSSTYLLIVMIMECFIILTLITLLVIKYNKKINNPLRDLEKGLISISKGEYNYELNIDQKSIIYPVSVQYKYMIEEISRLLTQMANQENTRKELLAKISHEIRTPLSYIKMGAEVLAQSENLTVSEKEYTNTIMKKISSIDIIIEDLFSYSRQDLNQLSVELKEVYARDMFNSIFIDIEKKYNRTKTISIQNNIPNVLIYADPGRMEQVVLNMIDNADKHTNENGNINIYVELEENHIILIIEDDGQGIKPKDLPYIFNPFYQGEQDSKTKRRGAGLGLTICDYIIQQHNGEIYTYSKLNKGTKFVIKLPEII
ncbi:HAMP domain-containing histidine kinase [Mycoplasmatota bacterium]|nr:HAMP domain-containing histidine kinase [Mycoplasmatota bacterium]